MAPQDIAKRAAACAAVREIEDGMRVGIGTGSTVAFAIDALGERCRAGLRIEAVATSLRSEAAARAAGIPLVDFAGLATVDLCIDGVDEIDDALQAIKGGGGAMLREKIVATAATRMIAIADASKLVGQLGAAPLPVEILPFAESFVIAAIARLGGAATVRRAADGALYLTDQANAVLDCAFGPIADPAALAAALSALPGLLDHGLFLTEIDALYVASGGDVAKRTRIAPR